jgi:hypothetical protein
MRSATTQAINDNAVYRLNCRPVKEIPAQGEVRFEMSVLVPPELKAGREFTQEGSSARRFSSGCAKLGLRAAEIPPDFAGLHQS